MKLSEMGNGNQKSFDSNSSKSQAKKNAEKTYNELKNCSQDELMAKLTQEIQKQKNNGEFNVDALRSAVEQIKIYLPDNVYQNMINIIENLK